MISTIRKMLGGGVSVDVAAQEVARLSGRETSIRERLGAAARKVQDARRQRTETLISADGVDVETSSADRKVSAVEAELAGLQDALSELSTRRTEAETALATARDLAERQAAEKVIAEVHGEIAAALDAWRQASAGLIESIARVSAGGLLAQQLHHTGAAFAGEVATLLHELQGRLASVAAGGPLPVINEAVAPPIAPPAAPAIERETVYSLEFLKWREGGEIRTASKYAQVHLPVHLVERALARHLVDRLTAPRTQNLRAYHGQNTGMPPRADDARLVDLDALDAPAEIEEAVA